ncbi:polysaccharide pyruvyl transferase family protein [Chthonobacter rhizosphaerae]|uniref:polysaccharide pyruvyl transferase family protein n=1 Tax=Chthonobacter rhizosphaerae TaxID=2735553 RepID=UPI0015EF86B5|nr:polysaccharide pyruvyl transferase family protein [Chthonobacter rhizosphaerae]
MKIGLISYTSTNLGDDLQSLAVAFNLPHVDRLVDRDRLAQLRLPERHLVVMNAWFTQQRILAPSDAIDPIFSGFCYGREDMKRGFWPRYLKKHQPIGCRDANSVDRLKRIGVDGHFAGCLTLRMGRFLRTVPKEERSGVYFVDVNPEIEPEIPADLRERAVRISNQMAPLIPDDPLARAVQIARTCDLLRHAEFVVTKRLHTALPCVGFRTPVQVLVRNQERNRHRFSGFDRFVPVRYFGKDAPPPAPIDWSARRTVDIPAELDARYEDFRRTVASKAGGIGERVYDSFHRRDVIRLKNPGFGPEVGRVAIDFGTVKVERVPLTWTDREITVDLESFASFERWRLPILVKPHVDGAWTEVARVCDVLA